MAGKNPCKRGKKNRNKKKGGSIPVSYTIHQYIYQSEQHGDFNTQVVYPTEEALTLLREREDASLLTHDEVIIGMLKSIINPTCSRSPDPMSLNEIRIKFKEIYTKEFDELSHSSLSNFLEKHSEWFEKYIDKKQRVMVRPLDGKKFVFKQKRKKDKQELISEKIGKDTSSEPEYLTATNSNPESSEEEQEEFGQNFLASRKFRVNESYQNGDGKTGLSDSENEEWQEVSRRKKRTSFVCQKPTTEHTDTASQLQIEQSDRGHVIEGLLLQKASHNLIFRKFLSEYRKNPYLFMVDLVSLWNSTSRDKAYIIIGVQEKDNLPHLLLGMPQSTTETELREIFDKNLFTAVPPFVYYEERYAGRVYGIVEIESSFGAGVPIITKTTVNDQGIIQWRENQLLIREHSSLKSLSFTDGEIGVVYQWFNGKEETSFSSKKRELNARENNEVSTTITKDQSDLHFSNLASFKECVKSFKKGQYILIAGDMSRGMKNMETISRVPWMYVFDFDFMSRDSGLLCSNEDFIKNKRALRLLTWMQHPRAVSENGTTWVSLRGRRDDPESVFQNDSENKNEVRDWFQKTKSNIDLHIDCIQRFIEDYTVVTVLMFWPLEEFLVQHMRKFLMRLDDGLDPKPRVVVCISSLPETKVSQSQLKLLETDLGDNVTIIFSDFEEVCECIGSFMEDQRTAVKVSYDLPTADKSGDPCIEESDAAWIREELEVLYLSNPYAKYKFDVSALEEEGEQFYRGGNLHWFAWYEVGTNHFDAQRDLMSDVMEKIGKYVNQNRSGTVTLLHSPGSGGTTLAQRVLWEYHEKVPCAQVKARSTLPLSELVARVEMLYSKTHKTILLLIDGADEGRVKELMRMLKVRCHVIILYVKRYPLQSKRVGKLLLEGIVSKQEAKRLALKFKSQCRSEQKKKRLTKLSEDVENGKQRLVYEFGLTAYLHEYKGIGKYVKGYLWPPDNQSTEATKLARKILGYLSLAYYYGQTALPIQFFGTLLHQPPEYLIELENFPAPVSEFVVYETNDNRSRNIRLTHFLVAKEILEQVLGKNFQDRTDQLSSLAKKNLADFCIDFISYAGKKKLKSSGLGYVLAKIFIFRDNKDIDIGENVEQARKKPVLSRLMSDIDSKGPLYTERLNVLKALTEAFPEDQNFHAHLGRFYANFRPNDDEKADECLRKATEICEKQTVNKKKEELDELLLLSLMHVYHMCGNILQRRIARYTSFSPTGEPEIETKKDVFHSRLSDLITIAKTACAHFRSSRYFSPVGHESSFGFTGEIIVRLQICDFIERNFCDNDNHHTGLRGYLDSPEPNTDRGKRFVSRSVDQIDHLLSDCLSVLDDDDTNYSIEKIVFWFNHLFHKNANHLEKIAKGENVHAYRLLIAAKKLKHGKGKKNIVLIEQINSFKDIKEVVHLYENIFKDPDSINESRSLLNRDYIEWMHAIRHRLLETTYSLEDVLQHVRTWKSTVNSPMSLFYLFILTSLIGFGENNMNGNSEFLAESRDLQKEMERLSKYVVKPKYPREWLGNIGKGIKVLEPGIRFVGYGIPEDRNLNPYQLQTLRMCKGSVCAPNDKNLAGFINLDLGNNPVPVRVFYIPFKAKLDSPVYANRRVEFLLGFSLDHGCEAFNVQLLKNYDCPSSNCSARVEILSSSKTETCPACRTTVHKKEASQS